MKPYKKPYCPLINDWCRHDCIAWLDNEIISACKIFHFGIQFIDTVTNLLLKLYDEKAQPHKNPKE